MPQVRFLPGAPVFTSLSCNFPFVKTNQNRSICAIFITKNSTKIAQKTHWFKKLILAILFCVLFSGCATYKPDPWTRDQILLQGVATTLNIIDWGQTLDIVDKPDQYCETNKYLGKHPSRRKVNKYFACSTGFQILVTHLMPSSWRKYWLGGNIMVSGYYVNHNYHIGLRVNF